MCVCVCVCVCERASTKRYSDLQPTRAHAVVLTKPQMFSSYDDNLYELLTTDPFLSRACSSQLDLAPPPGSRAVIWDAESTHRTGWGAVHSDLGRALMPAADAPRDDANTREADHFCCSDPRHCDFAAMRLGDALTRNVRLVLYHSLWLAAPACFQLLNGQQRTKALQHPNISVLDNLIDAAHGLPDASRSTQTMITVDGTSFAPLQSTRGQAHASFAPALALEHAFAPARSSLAVIDCATRLIAHTEHGNVRTGGPTFVKFASYLYANTGPSDASNLSMWHPETVSNVYVVTSDCMWFASVLCYLARVRTHAMCAAAASRLVDGLRLVVPRANGSCYCVLNVRSLLQCVQSAVPQGSTFTHALLTLAFNVVAAVAAAAAAAAEEADTVAAAYAKLSAQNAALPSHCVNLCRRVYNRETNTMDCVLLANWSVDLNNRLLHEFDFRLDAFDKGGGGGGCLSTTGAARASWFLKYMCNGHLDPWVYANGEHELAVASAVKNPPPNDARPLITHAKAVETDARHRTLLHNHKRMLHPTMTYSCLDNSKYGWTLSHSSSDAALRAEACIAARSPSNEGVVVGGGGAACTASTYNRDGYLEVLDLTQSTDSAHTARVVQTVSVFRPWADMFYAHAVRGTVVGTENSSAAAGRNNNKEVMWMTVAVVLLD